MIRAPGHRKRYISLGGLKKAFKRGGWPGTGTGGGGVKFLVGGKAERTKPCLKERRRGNRKSSGMARGTQQNPGHKRIDTETGKKLSQESANLDLREGLALLTKRKRS